MPVILIPKGSPYNPAAPAPCWGYTLSNEDGWKVVVKCGNGHVGSLLNHAIHRDGTVDPSLDCPEAGCDWHHRVQLDGWPTE